MGKPPKNFALLKRTENPRISLRRLQATTNSSASRSPSSSEEREKRENSNKELEIHGGVDGDDPDWTPSLSAIFKILFSMRLSSSLWSLISDCDEVYNYWEPLHLLLFGRGFQTWEYSPAFAIRSWLYILFYAAPAQLFLYVLPQQHMSKVTLFFSMRFFIGFLTLISELFLYRALCRIGGNSLGRAFVLFTLFSSAMFGAGCAFLPSTFSMVFNAFAMAFYLREQWFFAILCTATSALVGWPFAALLGLPIVLEMLVCRPRQLALKFMVYSTLAGTVLCGGLLAVDSHLFGRLVLAPVNIVLYNVFSAHGPNLYGIEPASFYIRNLLLNFNLAFPMALIALPLALLCHWLTRNVDKRRKDAIHSRMGRLEDWPLRRWSNFRPILFIGITAFLWLLVFLMQPHKEERFLFPVYPHLCLLAALCLDCLCRCIPQKWPQVGTALCIASVGLFAVASFSRIVALHRNYSGLMDTYKTFNEQLANGQLAVSPAEEFNKNNTPIRLCVGKEWHRFPSSFFLPEHTGIGPLKQGVEMHFLRHEFQGLLPGRFVHGTLPNATRHIPLDQNDENREEPAHYVPVETCDFLVDFEGPETTQLEPNYAKMPHFRSVIQRRVLLPAQSHPLFRAFYIPFTPSQYLTFGTIHMLQRTQPKPQHF